MHSAISSASHPGLTRTPLVGFSAAAVLLTATFFLTLEWAIVNQVWGLTIALPFFYASGMFGAGFAFGRKEKDSKGRPPSTGVKYHAATFFVVNAIYLLFILLRHRSMLATTIFGMVLWGIFVLLHLGADRLFIRYYEKMKHRNGEVDDE